MARKILVLSFDMETDIGSWTSGTKGITQGTPRILDILQRHEVSATFLFTGREALRHPEMVHRVRDAGHEIGCHTMFHENIGEPVYDVPVGGFILEREIEPRLMLATETVEQVAGVRPLSFRAPRLFGSTAMLKCLEKLGFLVDSSFPSYFHGRDFAPYHPSRENWAEPGSMHILEIPVFYDHNAEDNGDQNRQRDQWPMLRLRGGAYFADLCRRMYRRPRPAADNVLCVYLHPWEFAEMPSSVSTDESTITFKPFLHLNTGKSALEALDTFVGAMRADGVMFARMIDLADGGEAS